MCTDVALRLSNILHNCRMFVNKFIKITFKNMYKGLNNIHRSIAPCLGYMNQVNFYDYLIAPNFCDSHFSEPTPGLR